MLFPSERAILGEPDGNRTHDTLIKSQVLYRLSYGLPGRRADNRVR